MGFALNYILLSALCILLGYLFFPSDVDLRNGFVIMAAIPVAVAVVPFTYLLNGDTEYAMSVTALLYILAPILIPAAIYLLFGPADINFIDLLILDLQLILLPLILSRLLLLAKANRLPRWIFDIIVNIALVVIVYAIVGVNQPVFFSGEGFIYPIISASLIRTFGAGIAVEQAAIRMGVAKPLIPPLSMLASVKNMALTSTLALSLLSVKSSLPAVFCMLLEILFFIYLKARTYMRH